MTGVRYLGVLLSIAKLLKPTAAASTVTVSVNTAVCLLATSPFLPSSPSSSAVVVVYTTTNSEGSVITTSSTSFTPFSGPTGSRSVVIVYTSTGSAGNVFTSSTTSFAPAYASASAPFASIAIPPTSASSIDSSSSTVPASADSTSPCPAAIAAVYQSPSGNDYQLFCSTDFLSDDIPAQTVSTFPQCMSACDGYVPATTGPYTGKSCVAVTWTGDDNLAYTNCYLKYAIENVVYGNGTKYSAKRASYNPPVGGVSVSVVTPSGSATSTSFVASSSSSVLSSMLVSSSFQTAASSPFTATSSSSSASVTSTPTPTGPSSNSSVQTDFPCPASDGQVYDSKGSPSQQYRIMCGISILYDDLPAQTVDTFDDCIAACDSYVPSAQTDISYQKPCVAVDWAPEFINYTNCFLKSNVTDAIGNAQEDSAVLLAFSPSPAASTSVSSTSSISSISSISSTSPISSAPSTNSTSSPTGTTTLNCPASTFSPQAIAPCPNGDGQDFTTPDGRTYRISCGLSLGNNDLPDQTVATFEDCMNACDTYNPTAQNDTYAQQPCVAVNWAPEFTNIPNCFLKYNTTISSPSCQEDSAVLQQVSPSPTTSGNGAVSTNAAPSATSSHAPVSSAQAVFPCPDSNNTTYPSGSTRSYTILCGVSLQNYDLPATNAYTFQECMAACDNYVPAPTADPNAQHPCTGVDWAPELANYYNCFLKYATTNQTANAQEDSAILA